MQFLNKNAKEKRSLLEPLDFWLLKGSGAGGGEKRERKRQLLQKETTVSNGCTIVVVAGCVVVAVVVAKGNDSIERMHNCCSCSCYF